MFERFTDRARRVVMGAQEEARALGHGYIGTEHLLLGLLAEGEGLAARVLDNAGVDHDGVRAAVERIVGRGSAAPDDADALRAIGIDIDEVRARVEEAFGPGALEVARMPGRRRRRRRRHCGDIAVGAGGRIPFTPRSKRVMELALREALALGHGYIGTEHILLGVLAEAEGLAAEILVQQGVAPADLRRRVLAALGKVA